MVHVLLFAAVLTSVIAGTASAQNLYEKVYSSDQLRKLFAQAVHQYEFRADEPIEFRWAGKESHYVELNLYLNERKVWSMPRKTELIRTREGELPLANDSFFSFYLSENIPTPAELDALEIPGYLEQ